MPWFGLDIAAVRREYAMQGQGLAISETIGSPFSDLLRSGLLVEADNRDLTVELFSNRLGLAAMMFGTQASGSTVRLHPVELTLFIPQRRHAAYKSFTKYEATSGR